MNTDIEPVATHDEHHWVPIPRKLRAHNTAATLPARTARRWHLVLEARSIPCRVEQRQQGWVLLVHADLLDNALAELRTFEEKNRFWPPPALQSPPLANNTLTTLSVLLFVALFYNLTQLDIALPGHNSIDWISIGKMHGEQVRNGEWWRLVTALTLHANVTHLLGNLALGGIVIIFLCLDCGSGLAWCLVLGSGILGNLANALIQPASHSSIGASTLVFGAIGITAAFSLMRYRRIKHNRWQVPVAAALALLALLGTEGQHTDLGAHLFGFLAGLGLGLICEYLTGIHGRPGKRLNIQLALIAAGITLSAWLWALIHTS